MLITCPICGARSVEEFVYGGEERAAPPPESAGPENWFAYVYERENRDGPQREWWCHALGCQLWFLAERDTTCNRVLATCLAPESRCG